MLAGRKAAGNQQLPIALAEIALAQFHLRHLFALRANGTGGEGAFGREQVAVGPAAFGAHALAGGKTAGQGDGAHWCGFAVDVEIDRLCAILAHGAFARLDRHRAEQSGLHQCTAQILAAGVAVTVTGLEAGEQGDMLFVHALHAIIDTDGAKHAAPAKIDTLHQRGVAAGMIDGDIGQRNARERIAGIGKADRQAVLRRLHARGFHRIAHPDR